MKTGWEARKSHIFAPWIGALLAVVACGPKAPQPVARETPAEHRQVGQTGGRLTVALTSEPKTLNPAIARDITSRTVIRRMTADLIRINRQSQEAEAALAESWTVSADGRRYTLKLRRGLRFSDGHPCDGDDVVFTRMAV